MEVDSRTVTQHGTVKGVIVGTTVTKWQQYSRIGLWM
jgi:hypothetical protein